MQYRWREAARSMAGSLAAVAVVAVVIATPARAACDSTNGSLGVSRTIEIDASGGPIFGSMTKQVREPSFLKKKEVVLTFDDGPMPWVTRSVLDTLDLYCTRATFFSVGRMAVAYPAMIKEVLARGHTLGSHTYSHPLRMPRMKAQDAIGEIERGLAAVATAAGQPIAPFFRFPGLADSALLLAYLQTRHIASFSVDTVSNDSYLRDPLELVERTMAEVKRKNGGIILFHDIKRATVTALPIILARLKEQGYSVVHIVAKDPAVPLAEAMADIGPKLKGSAMASVPTPAARTGPREAQRSTAVVTSIAPAPRRRFNSEQGSGPRIATKAGNPKPGRTPDAATLALRDSVIEMTGPPIIAEALGGDGASGDQGWQSTTDVVAPMVAPGRGSRIGTTR